MATLSMLNDGYKVFPVADACGSWDDYEAPVAMATVSRGGAEVVATFALGCELQADWKLPSADAMSGPFTNQLPEYGWVAGNLWDNASQRAVPTRSALSSKHPPRVCEFR
jgi:hypothetical protein